ncbi:MAG: hypothetical protein H0X65_15835 [Gemmatimonadetes bacterium]|nr:hypothetical protein [Gemmatimonadota bacterium]
MIADLRRLLVWLDAHDSQLHDWKIYPASDLAATVTSVREQRRPEAV